MRGICGRRQRHRFKAMRKLIFQFGLSLAFLLALSVAAAGQGEGGRTLKWKVAIGRFSNETQYGKGIFYERENDPMAKQAYDILAAKLVASNKFILLERADADKLSAELNDGGESNRLAADYLILGSITEFGRKTTGKDNLFTATKTQTVEAGVAVRLVDVVTGVAIYSEEAKGFAETTSKSTLGLGGKMGFDATLSDKAISSAVDQLVENIINKYKHIFILPVTEIFSHGKSCHRNSSSWTRSFIHLSKDHRCLVHYSRISHFMEKVISFSCSLSYSTKN